MRPTMFRSVRKWWVGPTILAVALGCAAAGGPAGAQQTKKLPWSHAFDLACRKFGEAEFTDKTQKFGVEAFKDDNNNLGLYVSEKGGLAVAPGFQDLKLP